MYRQNYPNPKASEKFVVVLDWEKMEMETGPCPAGRKNATKKADSNRRAHTQLMGFITCNAPHTTDLSPWK